jgi:nitrogen fixation NifU-like protein
MMRELYQEMILDHNRNPRNKRAMPEASAHADGHNPLCGDQVTVYLDVADGIIRDISFEGQGCAISTASASLMTETLVGKPVAEAEKIFQQFHGMVTEGEHPEFEEDLEKLEVLGGVNEFPMRVKCATLAWHTMHAALEGEEVVSTE